ncbi:SETD8 family protein [Megaselia abdita]
MAEFSLNLNKFKRSNLKKQQQQQTSSDDAASAFIFTRSQQKCNNISIQLPFEIRSHDKDSLDTADSLANNNLFLQTPVLKLKIDKSLQEISPMEINRLAAKNEPISIFSKCDFDLTSPNRNINNNLHLDHSTTTMVTSVSTPNIEGNKKHKAPTTPHRILCQFRSIDAAVPEELATKIPENNNENDNKLKRQKKAIKKNRELTEFFPVRRSVRKTKTAVKEEIIRNYELAIREQRQDGLEIRNFKDKGRGIVSSKTFERGDFVIEYTGDLIEVSEANEREKKYSLDEKAGCYMYYFKYNNHQYCIDATAETGTLGRLVNHSRNGNLLTKVITVNNRPHLILIAKDNIPIGRELTYDYGDRSKEALLHHPWLAL